MKAIGAAAMAISLIASTGDPAQAREKGRLDLTIDTDRTVGVCYRFWTVNVFTSQHQFTGERYGWLMKRDKPYMRGANCVRLLGGRDDKRNNWYKGVDEEGKVKVDFSGLVSALKAIIDLGYTPRLVLDNVPTAMSTITEMHKYGNTNPPDDYGLWRQYITALVETLVREFGLERVKGWRFRVGTEPDLFPNHWNGTREQYFKHYDITVDAVTRILPEADIGPGNILNPEGHWKNLWGLDIIDHCAKGTNHVTGKTSTRMRYFAISYYGGVGKAITLEASIAKVRARLNRYPALKDIPLDVQEFGILHDEHRQRLWGNDITEWGASWYAAVSDIVYRNGVAEVYEWSQSTGGLPHPRLHVNRMLERMADGKRLDVAATGKAAGRAGAIACIKGDKVYVLLYNHHPLREAKVGNTLSLEIRGAHIAETPTWNMNEWTIDHDHGVWAYAMYRDCAEACLEPLPKTPIYGGQPYRRFGEKWRSVFAANKARYTKLAALAQTVKGKTVPVRDGAIALEFDMPDHSVKLIELAPRVRVSRVGDSEVQE